MALPFGAVMMMIPTHPHPGRTFIPDEHLVWCPEQLLQCVLAHIHYIPDHWQGNAHKSETREELAQLFQYKAVSGLGGGLDQPPNSGAPYSLLRSVPPRSSSWRSC